MISEKSFKKLFFHNILFSFILLYLLISFFGPFSNADSFLSNKIFAAERKIVKTGRKIVVDGVTFIEEKITIPSYNVFGLKYFRPENIKRDQDKIVKKVLDVKEVHTNNYNPTDNNAINIFTGDLYNLNKGNHLLSFIDFDSKEMYKDDFENQFRFLSETKDFLKGKGIDVDIYHFDITNMDDENKKTIAKRNAGFEEDFLKYPSLIFSYKGSPIIRVRGPSTKANDSMFREIYGLNNNRWIMSKVDNYRK